jgi:hypothetical protein
LLLIAPGIGRGNPVGFHADFNAGTVGPSLTDPSDSYEFTPGADKSVFNASGIRNYVSTINSYGQVDFTFRITYDNSQATTPPVADGRNLAFFGFGDPTPDPGFFGEPRRGVYLRVVDDFWHVYDQGTHTNGESIIDVSDDAGRTENPISEHFVPQGQHQVIVRKSGTRLSFTIPVDSNNNEALESSIDLAGVSLDLRHAKLFFGVESSAVRFDNVDVKVSAIPLRPAWQGFGVTSALYLICRIGIRYRARNAKRCR